MLSLPAEDRTIECAQKLGGEKGKEPTFSQERELAAGHGTAQLTVPFAAGVFILPFFLFSATAGQLADKFNKARLIRIVKFVEILVSISADQRRPTECP